MNNSIMCFTISLCLILKILVSLFSWGHWCSGVWPSQPSIESPHNDSERNETQIVKLQIGAVVFDVTNLWHYADVCFYHIILFSLQASTFLQPSHSGCSINIKVRNNGSHRSKVVCILCICMGLFTCSCLLLIYTWGISIYIPTYPTYIRTALRNHENQGTL